VGGGLVNKYKRDRIAEEEAHASKVISKSFIPPCSAYANVFGKQAIPHIHLPPTWMIDKIGPFPEAVIPPFSGFTWPYEEVTSNDPDSESPWASPEERETKVKEYFSQFTIGSSLCVFYYNFDNPINGLGSDPDQNRYVVAGFSRLKSVGDSNGTISIARWNDMDPNTERESGNQIWAIPYTHAFEEHGFLMPIHDILRESNGVQKAQEIALYVPWSMNPSFKYVCNTLTDDQLIHLLEEAIFRITYACDQGYISEESALMRLERAEAFLREAKTNRTKYPGVGAVFEYLGISRGRELHRVHLSKLAESGTDLQAWFRAGITAGTFAPIGAVTVPTSVIGRFRSLSPDIQRFLVEIAFRIDLTAAQIDEITRQDERWQFGFSSPLSAINENPYLISEEYIPGQAEDEDSTQEVPIYAIDHMMLDDHSPTSFEDPATGRERLRGLAVDELRLAQREGHTYLLMNDLVERLNQRLKKDDVSIRPEFIKGDADFFQIKIQIDGDRVFLKETYDDERFIEGCLQAFLAKDPISFSDNIDWDHPPKRADLSDERYQRAISRQNTACNKMLRSRVSVVTGSAGTGKTEIAKTFKRTLLRFATEKNCINDFAFMGAAFTGKAANNLNKRISNSFTIHRLLVENAEISQTGNYIVRRVPTGRLRIRNLVIDECSMLEVTLMANLFRIIDWAYLDRLILIGDPFQLPPIGPGKPFYDLIQALKVMGTVSDSGFPDDNEFITSLRETVRLNKEESSLLEFGGLFAGGSRSSLLRILGDIKRLGQESDIQIVTWETEDNLHQKLVESFRTEIMSGLKEGVSNFDAFTEFVANGERIDRIQITSPYNVEHFGTEEINEKIQSFLNEGTRRRKIKTSANTFYHGDKIIQVRNVYERPRNFQNFKEGRFDVYNGYQGILRDPRSVKNFDKRGTRYLKVATLTFEGQAKNTSIYKVSHLRSEVKPGFCITVHKAQGSEFSVNLFILPKLAKALPRELIYTGLTRGVDKTILFLEKRGDEALERILLDLSTQSNSAIEGRNSSLFDGASAPLNDFRIEGRKHQHTGGRKFRSKSEMLVYNVLLELAAQYGWRVDYEQMLEIEGAIRAPDFKLITQRKTFWVEHIGLHEGSAKYRKDWEEKNTWYQTHGVLDQLIITTEGRGLNLMKVRDQILDKVKESGAGT
jgi:hypothetical protein